MQSLAQKNYRIWRSNPDHPSLHFKSLAGRGTRFSIRVGLHHRAVGWKPQPGIVEWVWIGSHADYDSLLKHR